MIHMLNSEKAMRNNDFGFPQEQDRVRVRLKLTLENALIQSHFDYIRQYPDLDLTTIEQIIYRGNDGRGITYDYDQRDELEVERLAVLLEEAWQLLTELWTEEYHRFETWTAEDERKDMTDSTPYPETQNYKSKLKLSEVMSQLSNLLQKNKNKYRLSEELESLLPQVEDCYQSLKLAMRSLKTFEWFFSETINDNRLFAYTLLKNYSQYLERFGLDAVDSAIRIIFAYRNMSYFYWPRPKYFFQQFGSENVELVFLRLAEFGLFQAMSEDGSLKGIGGDLYFPRRDLIAKVLRVKHGYTDEKAVEVSEQVRNLFYESSHGANWQVIFEFFGYDFEKCVEYFIEFLKDPEYAQLQVGMKGYQGGAFIDPSQSV